jgi:hypothetical protein
VYSEALLHSKYINTGAKIILFQTELKLELRKEMHLSQNIKRELLE